MRVNSKFKSHPHLPFPYNNVKKKKIWIKKEPQERKQYRINFGIWLIMTIVALLLACSVWMAGVLKRNENVMHYMILIFGRDGKENAMPYFHNSYD